MTTRTIMAASPVYVEADRLTDGLPTMHVASVAGRTASGPVTWCGLPTAPMRLGAYQAQRLGAQGCPACFHELMLA